MQPDQRKCMVAFAQGMLPLQPGDVVRFTASGHLVYVVAATEQEVQEAQPGQRLYGMIVAPSRISTWHEFFLEWRGFDGVWTFVRPGV